MSSVHAEPAATLTSSAVRVLERRYLVRDDAGRIAETPDGLFRRVALCVAEADRTLPFQGRRDPERSAASFHAMMRSLEFLPNSPTLMNAGREVQQLCACFVLPVEDSMEGIFESLKQAAIIHKTGGGTGFSFSRLRPRNSRVRSTRGVASGPVSFMRVYDAATEAIKQGGTRRGANMGVLRVDHPDILEFIDCKRDGTGIVNFNISVAVTDGFMDALAADTDYPLSPPAPAGGPARLRARDVFERMVDGAWACGDPGVIFIDRINAANPTSHVAPIEATNPCGEQPLAANEACTLGSINLGRMIDARGRDFDLERLRRTVHEAVHFLDNVIEVNHYPLPVIEGVTRSNRRIGLGVMGWADALIAMEIPYDSDEALSRARRVMRFIDEESKVASAALAAERGAYPAFAGSRHQLAGGAPLRNATTTTVAPTGTISIIAGASSGIEPLFAVAYARRNILDLAGEEEMYEVHPAFVARADALGIMSDRLLAEVAAAGSPRRLRDGRIPAPVARVFATAWDVSPEWHVRMQAAFQEHCDNAVSKTVNLPATATRDDVRTAFMTAWQLGCKGVTIYRDRSRRRQVLYAGPPGRRASHPLAHLSVAGERVGLETLGRAMHRAMIASRAARAAPRAACPDCSGTLRQDDGCLSCRYCGYSRCN